MRLQKKSLLVKLFFMLTFYAAASHAQSYKFDFGSGAASSGYIQVTPQTDFTIQTEHHSEAVRVRMYRMDGKIVLNRKMTGSNRYQLPINHLENGLYLLELVSRNGARVFNISLFK
ncbi:MAG TPA: T9SS type A sorting domain-containing protein [Chitinispirillaceae bacterium]|nr:T9SS type A sorting domain-containing protein [Chitinispirillaceae bacterium]